MANPNKFTTKEVLNKVLLDSSGNAVTANSVTAQEALNTVLDTTNNRLNMSLAGGTISGDVTITGDLTVNSGTSSLVFDESVVGDMSIKGADGGTLYLQTSHDTIAASDVLGQIHFQAPDDTGADSDLIGATIQALATDTFSDTVNKTDLLFMTGASEVATEKMRITSAGVLSLTSGQINFPDTQNASTDANTLDDYQEGTWTPILCEMTTVANNMDLHADSGGIFTKVGNLVFASCYIQVTGNGDATNETMGVHGLPFTAKNTPGNKAGIVIGENFNLGLASGSRLGGFISPGTATLFLKELTNNAYSTVTRDEISNDAFFSFTVTYIADA